jgi:hypothetical protein
MSIRSWARLQFNLRTNPQQSRAGVKIAQDSKSKLAAKDWMPLSY